MQIVSKFTEVKGAAPDFHGGGGRRAESVPLDVIEESGDPLKVEKNYLIIKGGKMMKGTLQQRYKK